MFWKLRLTDLEIKVSRYQPLMNCGENFLHYSGRSDLFCVEMFMLVLLILVSVSWTST